ncbi:LytTR family DNA-binding domain-containing protein [Hoeflea ulvae]|uniref:LytTR family transcriptional regulator n=1 Tax=Hoeflea ulvae TaxID=2983764 RepID=A0ABT3YJN4_9HYPH|nr:LytTR family DNA-binding domain-containing protein [Hoeflea ulvae]MCY0096112.1 LytTR family transcriptional regulator [Hoeflea ulvae]
MSDTLLQSTLRELRLLLSRPRLWLVFALVVGLFVLTGPFGSYERLPFHSRLGYWLTLQSCAWGCALVSVSFFDVALTRHIAHRLTRMMTGAIFAALPIGFVVTAVNAAVFQMPFNLVRLGGNVLVALPIGIGFCLLVWLSLSSSDEVTIAKPADATVPETDPTAAGLSASPPAAASACSPEDAVAQRPPLLDRLPVDKRGVLIRLEVQDHYVRVVTSRGSELLLMRLGDAIAEAGPGQQVHRSHWVAEHEDNALLRGNGKNGRLSVNAADGADVPVSRTFAPRVQSWIGQRDSV